MNNNFNKIITILMFKCCCWRKDNNNLNINDSKIKIHQTSSKLFFNQKDKLFNISSNQKININNNKITINRKKNTSNSLNIKKNNNKREFFNNEKIDLKNDESIFFNKKNNKSRNIINNNLNQKYLTQSPCQKVKFSYFDEYEILNELNIQKNNNHSFFKNKVSQTNKTEYNKSIKVETIKNDKIKKVKENNLIQDFEENITEKNKEFTMTNIKLISNINSYNYRHSVINYETFHLKKEVNIKKTCSLMPLYEKNEKIIEISILMFLTKHYRFLTRENLIEITYFKNIKNIINEKLNLNNGKGEINLYITNIKGRMILDKILVIGPLGLINNSRRNAEDTLTFFGYSEIKDCNDYILNNTSFIYNNKTFTKTLFAISYDHNSQKYFIQPILDNNKQGRFILVNISNKNFSFINNKVILLNKTIIQLMPSNNTNRNNLIYNMNVRIFEYNNNNKGDDIGIDICINNVQNEQEIKIGFDENNTIQLKNNNKINNKDCFCSIILDKEREIWSIKGKDVWLVLDHKFSLIEETLIKIGDDIIKMNVNH